MCGALRDQTMIFPSSILPCCPNLLRVRPGGGLHGAPGPGGQPLPPPGHLQQEEVAAAARRRRGLGEARPPSKEVEVSQPAERNQAGSGGGKDQQRNGLGAVREEEPATGTLGRCHCWSVSDLGHRWAWGGDNSK